MKNLFIILWMGMMPVFAQSQDNFLQKGSPLYHSLSLMHDFRFKEAKDYMEKNKSTVRRGEYLFFHVNYYWWLYVISNDKKIYHDSLVNFLNQANEFYKKNNEERSYIALMTYGFDYRLAFKEDRFIDALRSAHKTARRIQTSLDSAEYSPYYKLTAAIYLFSTGYGREKYWYLYPYFLTIPDGDIQKGLDYLRELSGHSNPVIATEASYVLMRIYRDVYENYSKAYKESKKLVQVHPDNLFYLALHLQHRDKTGLLTPQDITNYRNKYQHTDFINDASKNFFKNWRNIR